MGGRGYGGGGRGRVYTYRYTVTTRMICIEMDSGESHFNVSLIERDKVTRQCPQTTTFSKRKESRSGIEPRSFRLPAYRLTAGPDWLCKQDGVHTSQLLKRKESRSGGSNRRHPLTSDLATDFRRVAFFFGVALSPQRP